MLVVMQQGASEAQIQGVIDRLVSMNFTVHRSTGVLHTVLGGVGPMDDFDPAEQGVSWPDFARGYGRWLRRVILRHRDGAKMVGGTFVGGVLHAPTDFALRKFMAAGFSLRDATYAVSTIYCYVVGSVVEEQAAGPEAAESAESFDDRFEAGLKIIVRGLKPDLHYR